MFKKIAEKLKIYEGKSNVVRNTAPVFDKFLPQKNEYLNKISRKAIELYEKQSDINNFSKLVLSNPDNNDYIERVESLFDNGVIDPFIDEKLEKLSDNKKILKDLGLI